MAQLLLKWKNLRDLHIFIFDKSLRSRQFASNADTQLGAYIVEFDNQIMAKIKSSELEVTKDDQVNINSFSKLYLKKQ